MSNIADRAASVVEDADHGPVAVIASIEDRRRQRHEAPEQIKGFSRVLSGHRLDDGAPLGLKVIS
jgi:hypothetical protein